MAIISKGIMDQYTMATISKGIMDRYMTTIKKLRLNSNAYTWIRAYDSTLEKRPLAIKKRSSWILMISSARRTTNHHIILFLWLYILFHITKTTNITWEVYPCYPTYKSIQNVQDVMAVAVTVASYDAISGKTFILCLNEALYIYLMMVSE